MPDATTRALELRKGSADVAINALTPDTIVALERDPALAVERAPGTVLAYLGFNLRDPILKDVRVRQAIAYALDRRPMIEYLWHGAAQPARSVLPPQSWAYNGNVPPYDHNPDRARELLDAAGYPAVNGVRFHITMKTSTDENTRLMVAVMQQQLREVGIALDIRSFEFATFFADVTHGVFPDVWVCAGLAATRIPTFLNMRFTPPSSRRTAPTAASTPIRESTPLSIRPAAKSILRCASRSMPNCRQLWPTMFPTSISGIWTTFWCTTGACGI